MRVITRRTRWLLALLVCVVISGAAFPPAFFWYYEGPRTYRTSDGLWATFTQHGGESAIELTRTAKHEAPAPAELLAAAQLLENARKAASHFADYSAAVTRGGYTISIGESHNLFHHVFNPDYMADGRSLDPDRPESLLYYRTPHGMKLVSLMFIERPGARGEQIGGGLTRWHYHPVVEFCMDAQGIPRIYAEKRLKGGCPEGMHNGPTPEMMHVWLVDNPYGAFAHEMVLPDAHTMELHDYNPYTEFARRTYLFVSRKVSGRKPWARPEEARALKPFIPPDVGTSLKASQDSEHNH